jgi:hypothetical protein
MKFQSNPNRKLIKLRKVKISKGNSTSPVSESMSVSPSLKPRNVIIVWSQKINTGNAMYQKAFSKGHSFLKVHS